MGAESEPVQRRSGWGTNWDDPRDPQLRNRSGTDFRVNDPALAMAEIAYAYAILPGTATLGGWHHFGRFESPRLDAVGGRRLADPEASGIARRFHGNQGVYGILDQTLYREPDASDQGASAFVRLSGVPGERNLIDLYGDAGIAYKGLIPGRPNDTIGLGVIHSRLSPAARGYDRDLLILGQGAIGRGFAPIRSSETVIEATYQAQVLPGLTMQPDLQYVMRPGGGLVDAAGRRMRKALVVGLRATINY